MLGQVLGQVLGQALGQALGQDKCPPAPREPVYTAVYINIIYITAFTKPDSFKGGARLTPPRPGNPETR